jgi:CubicO group peptidase (beta-lactamase class C family)
MSITALATALSLAVAPDFAAILERLRTEQETPGVSAVITRGNQVVFAGGSGLADLDSGREMTPDTVLYAGSLTKIFTAVLTLGLVEEGMLRLAEPVPGIGRDGAEVTVAHLLTHASGLAREGNFGYWFSADFPDGPALTRYLADTELRSPPGAALHYSNVGYGALGLMVERATGQAYGAALRARVLQPLGMASSGAPGPAPDVAAGYTPVGRIIPSRERPFAGVGRQVGQRHLREYHDARAMSPAFGAFTTARDLGRLTRFLLGHGGDAVLSTEMRARMHTRQASGWGLGLKVGRYQDRPVARHEGWFAAHRSHLLLDLGDEIGVAVLSNSDSAAPAVIAEALFAATLNGHPEWEQ